MVERSPEVALLHHALPLVVVVGTRKQKPRRANLSQRANSEIDYGDSLWALPLFGWAAGENTRVVKYSAVAASCADHYAYTSYASSYDYSSSLVQSVLLQEP